MPNYIQFNHHSLHGMCCVMLIIAEPEQIHDKIIPYYTEN